MTNTNTTPSNSVSYSSHYNDSAFWRVVKKVGANVAYPALLLYHVLKSPNVPLKVKAEIVGALGYLILPLDLIPDWLPVVGYTDDLTALLAVIRNASPYITKDAKAAAKAKISDWFGADYVLIDSVAC